MILRDTKHGPIKVDEGDLSTATSLVWTVARFGKGLYYAFCRTSSNKTIYLHRHLMNAPEGYEVDHINGDGLDNRRENLRVCTHKQNLANQGLSAANTSGYRGVTRNTRPAGWRAQIKSSEKGQKPRCLVFGTYSTKEAAAYAYDLAARERYGEYARLNLLKPGDDLAAIQRYVQKHRCGKAAERLEACG